MNQGKHLDLFLCNPFTSGENICRIDITAKRRATREPKALSMKSLPTTLTTAQLDGILSSIEKLPSAKVNRYPTIITVTATLKTTGKAIKVLSATSLNGTHWHVMAIPGLVSTTTKYCIL